MQKGHFSRGKSVAPEETQALEVRLKKTKERGIN